MKYDDDQRWYMTCRWENCKCNDENYNWQDDFTWGNKYDYNDDFQWECQYECDHDNCNNYPGFPLIHSNCEFNEEETDGSIKSIEEIEEVEEVHGDNVQGLQGPQGPQGPPGPVSSWIKKTCVEPMGYVLEQLMKMEVDDLEIGTEKQGTILNCRIIYVEESLVKIQTQYNYVVIPIYEIIGLYSNKMKDILLMSQPEEEQGEDAECCEGSLRKYLLTKVGVALRINTCGTDELFRSIYGTITKVGKGTLILSNKMIIQISKIVCVEEEFE
ncbi:hypothetical protein ADU80_10730 [Clostridium botulinum]|uniref:Uncharacterized protein n=1 Tax=Clostridium botulinum TaxID=1491 RepID=A0A9Q1ZDF4_CLOBO|nr:hypothetical protein [Clostridium botulinum]AEB75529.1 hypothetical protein CbC4_0849 [Clostridium botulinum BKT015925]KEI03532.1 hypothetical protein Y848_04640 [Clostridium botulinum C/D str. Sp77]KOA73776.1 hypothetical protein ADU77_13450 [Clostridium botulinum]KOA83965.1 hypothetical protein ADU80_10730 [Clostridium botulinum]KOA87380.1 hypothetical protein ADU75_04825 [Clostridium botulinum]